MKNPAPQVRKALYELLNGQLTYEGQSVPVFESIGKPGVPVQVLIKEYTDSPDANKHYFGGFANQLIEVQSEQSDERSKIIDTVGEQVLDLLKPSPRVNGLSAPDFQILALQKQSQNYLTEEIASGKILKRLLIRIKFTITEK